MVEKPKSAEMNPGPGFRIRKNITRPDPAIIQGLADYDTPSISDLMNRLYTMVPAIKNQTPPELKIKGPACTVKVFPGDNLMVHKSLDIAKPGDVVVIDAGGSSMNAVLGDLVSTKARHRGIAGFVIDGYCRDLPGIVSLGNFPVFARGITPIGPLHRGPGEINFPIQCGGIVVHPGDIIIGDSIGVIVIPQGIAASLLQRLNAKKETEAAYLEGVRRGDFSNKWVEKLLAEAGCEMIDE